MPGDDTGAEPLNSQPQEYTEPQGSDEAAPPRGKGREGQAFRDLSRRLTPDELSNPGVSKMILDLHDTLQDENEELRGIREKFHVRDKKVEVLEERLKEATAREVVLGAVLTAGSLILGYTPSLWSSESTKSTSGIALAAGIILVLGSVFASFFWKRPVSSVENKP